MLRPESCNVVGACTQAGEGLLGGVAGLNFVVNWPSWCDGRALVLTICRAERMQFNTFRSWGILSLSVMFWLSVMGGSLNFWGGIYCAG